MRRSPPPASGLCPSVETECRHMVQFSVAVILMLACSKCSGNGKEKNISLVHQGRLHRAGGVDLRCNGCAGLFSSLGSGDTQPHEMSRRSGEYNVLENCTWFSIPRNTGLARLVIQGEGQGMPGRVCISIMVEGWEAREEQ